MNAEIKYQINLHKEGKIGDNALDKALNALQPTQTVESDIPLPALEKLRKRRRDKKKKRRQSRKYAELQKERELKQVLKARNSVSELKLVDNPLRGYFKAYEIDASEYKDASILFTDKNQLSPVK